MTLLFNSTQVIHTSVLILETQQTFLATFIYGFNTALEREQLWTDLNYISCTATAQAWICVGDFNVVRSVEEKHGGVQS